MNHALLAGVVEVPNPSLSPAVQLATSPGAPGASAAAAGGAAAARLTTASATAGHGRRRCIIGTSPRVRGGSYPVRSWTPNRAVRQTRRRARGPIGASVQVYSDPLQHALIAAAVAAPLVPRPGAACCATAVAAALVIDVDHAVAARSLRVARRRPRSPRGRAPTACSPRSPPARSSARPPARLHGWAAFSGLVSHLLHDAGDRAAPTPLLWPFAPARQLGRRRQLAAPPR